MPKRTRNAPESRRDEPLRGERRVRAEDAVLASIQLMTTLAGGAAGAVADGFQAFDEELSDQNVRERGLFNGLVEGMIAGQTRFLRSLAESGDRVQENLRDFEGDTGQTPAPEPHTTA